MSVETKNGVVFLSGSVDTIAKKQKVLQIANSINGVDSVNDKMVLKAANKNAM